jgi:acetylglutamate kinase
VRLRALHGRPVVVKLGGSAMEVPAVTRGTLDAVVTLHALGMRIALVHGGGKPIDRAMADAGLQPVKVQGRRYTDDRTLEIVVRVLGELNAGVVAQLEALGGAATGYTDRDSFPISGDRLRLPGLDLQPIDLGRVGQIARIMLDDLEADLERDRRIPVVPSLAVDEDGGWLNVNADSVASGVAGALGAESVLFLTDTPGVLTDRHDPKSLLPKLTVAECRELIASGVIDGGMIPKVEACFEALTAGANRAVILDGRNPDALLAEFLGEPGGTEVVP